MNYECVALLYHDVRLNNIIIIIIIIIYICMDTLNDENPTNTQNN